MIAMLEVNDLWWLSQAPTWVCSISKKGELMNKKLMNLLGEKV